MEIYFDTFDPKSIFPNCVNPTKYEQTIIDKIKSDVEKWDLKWIVTEYRNKIHKDS